MDKIKNLILTSGILIFFTSQPIFSIGQDLNKKNTQFLSDEKIEHFIESEYTYRPEIYSQNIEIDVNDGIATIDGTVSSLVSKEKLFEVASAVKGVKGIIDQVELYNPLENDEVLQDRLYNAILLDPVTESFEVNTSVNEGIATLSGTVDSWYEKEAAERVAKSVIGMKDVDNQINVALIENRLDSEIVTEIKDRLDNDVRVDNALIVVEAEDGIVRLSGVVGSKYEALQAQEMGWVTGVNKVHSELEIEPWARNDKLREGKYIFKEDAEIKNALETAFIYDPRVNSWKPQIDVKNGIVTLRGEVNHIGAKKAAEENAHNIIGVLEVINYLTVNREESVASDQLTNTIREYLKMDPLIKEDQLNVSLQDGIVSISGTANSFYERRRVEELIYQLKGVSEINNQIEVRNANPTAYEQYSSYFEEKGFVFPTPFSMLPNADQDWTDEQILNAVNNQIFWSTHLDHEKILVEVKEGLVTLSGSVDTKQERKLATVNALEGGAVAVNNQLVVNYQSNEMQSSTN